MQLIDFDTAFEVKLARVNRYQAKLAFQAVIFQTCLMKSGQKKCFSCPLD